MVQNCSIAMTCSWTIAGWSGRKIGLQACATKQDELMVGMVKVNCKTYQPRILIPAVAQGPQGQGVCMCVLVN